MSIPPSAETCAESLPEPAAVLRDEVAEHRVRRAQARQVPAQRPEHELSEPEREDYELRLDAYEVQLADYRSRLEAYAAQLDAAHHDGLTGAWLRHAGRQLLEEELQRAERTGVPLCIAFVDVDGLKERNDRLGHAAGDHALITIARALIVGLRGYDHVVRWGGDEFLCLLPGLTAPEAARRLEQARGFLVAGGQQLSISIGIAELQRGETVEQLVGRADRALYAGRAHRRS
jgi:diguanylate cyclase (GGDEF)-like protein